jgi:hypothetical protein
MMMKMKSLYKVTLLVLVIAFFSACSTNKFNVNVDNVDVDLNVHRVDSLLFTGHPDTVAHQITTFVNEFPEFSELYFHKILKIGSPYSKDFYDLFTLFLSEYDICRAYKESKTLYADFSPYEHKIQKAFQHYKYYFPQKNVPDVYLMMTGFNQSIVVADDILGIGVDKFLGSDSRFYDQLQFSKYLRKRMDPKVLPYEAVKGWMLTEFPFNDSIDNLVSNMIYHGKILYLMDALFPNAEDSIKIAYTIREMQWCQKSEDDVWLYMMDKKILFDNDAMLVRRFVADAPFTGPYGQNSPGRVGQWVGWQIVRSYMKKNDEVTIPQLMANDDYQKILLQSGYNP